MQLLLLLSALAAIASADTCPQSINFPSGVTNFGPWHASSNSHCSFKLYQQSSSSFETIELSIGNIGPSDRVTISSKNGNVLLMNRKYFKETFSIFNTWVIDITTGNNTQLVMEFDAAEGDAYNPPEVATLEFPTPVRSFVLYLDEWLPYTAITFSNPDSSQQIVIQKAEIISDPADFIQWSNVLVYDEIAVGSLFNLIGDSGAYVSEHSSVTLHLTQPMTFKGALLITTSNNVKKFDSYGVMYANPALPTQTFAIGYATAKKSCVTVIGDRDGSTPIDIRTASASSPITVTTGGPNRNHDIVLPLNYLPVSMIGNLWTFYLDQGNGIVKFSTNS